jgi:hypothetical protein
MRMLRRRGQRWRLGGAGVARIPEPARATVTNAAGVVLGLALAMTLVATVGNTSPLPARARWLLLLLALIAGILAVLHRQGTL